MVHSMVTVSTCGFDKKLLYLKCPRGANQVDDRYFLAGAATFFTGAFLAAPAGGAGAGPSRSNLMLMILTGVLGLSLAPRGTVAILVTTSWPSTTWPKIV